MRKDENSVPITKNTTHKAGQRLQSRVGLHIRTKKFSYLHAANLCEYRHHPNHTERFTPLYHLQTAPIIRTNDDDKMPLANALERGWGEVRYGG